MADMQKALATQLANIEKRTGRSMAELTAIVQRSGLTKHGELVATQVEVGLNAKGLDAGGRMKEVPPGQMCNYKVRLSDIGEVDDALVAWLRAAYDGAG